MDRQFVENVKNLEMADFSFHLSEKCKAETGQSIVSQVTALINYAHLRDTQAGPEKVYGTEHKHTVY